MKSNSILKKGVNPHRICSLVFCAVLFNGCSILATRPVQEMADTAAAIRAAREVQADTLAPELYRQSTEWFFRAKHEYKFKNFKLAFDYSEKAKHLAEQAEFEAIRQGGNRTEQAIPDPLSNSPSSSTGSDQPKAEEPYPYPTPEATPVEVYDQRKAEDEARRKAEEEARAKANQPVPQPTYIVPGQFGNIPGSITPSGTTPSTSGTSTTGTSSTPKP